MPSKSLGSLCHCLAPSQALSELLRFFVDRGAAPALWISGLPLDDEIPATPALPGDFRLPVSKAAGGVCHMDGHRLDIEVMKKWKSH